MNTLTLQRNVQFIYEEQLARIEMQAFGCEDLQRDTNNPWQFKVRLNGTDTDVLKRAAYIGTLEAFPRTTINSSSPSIKAANSTAPGRLTSTSLTGSIPIEESFTRK